MRRVVVSAVARLLRAASTALVLVNPGFGYAENAPVRVIQNDRGGYIGARAIEVADLNARGIRIELRGQLCLSSCTMYLGVDNVCLIPETTFGFHGPSRHGRHLPQSEFEHWSQVIARHYHPALQSWFLQDARHTVSGYKRISGRQLIDIGYPAC